MQAEKQHSNCYVAKSAPEGCRLRETKTFCEIQYRWNITKLVSVLGPSMHSVIGAVDKFTFEIPFFEVSTSTIP